MVGAINLIGSLVATKTVQLHSPHLNFHKTKKGKFTGEGLCIRPMGPIGMALTLWPNHAIECFEKNQPQLRILLSLSSHLQ